MRSYFRGVFVLIGALAALLFWTATPGYAQSGTGDLTGTIYDPSGAAVADAKVGLKNSETGAERSMNSTSAGTYRFTALPVVGTYSLTVELSGFRTAKVSGIVISVGLTVTVDVNLEIGAATEVITVEAGAELVTPAESQISELVDRRVWQGLPLEVRNQNEFINLVAGTVPNEFGGTTRGTAVNGARPGSGNFLLEGYDNNDQGQGGRGSEGQGAIVPISPEAIQEYRVITHSYSAQYGKGGGFVTDTVLKSGTNSWHGSLFEYNRVQALAANDFFSNAAQIKDKLVRNQFGGSVGGPVWKDKTFFYGSYEAHRRRIGFPRTGLGTTQEFINFVDSGAFQQFMESDPNGFCVQFNGAACAGAFANSGTLGPLVRNLLQTQFFPLAQRNFTNDAAGLLTAGLVYPVPVYGDVTVPASDVFNQHRVSYKMDHTLNRQHTLSGTFLFEDSADTTTVDGGDTTIGPPIINDHRNMIIGLTLTSNFAPTVINQFRASFLRNRSDFPPVPGLEGIPSIVTGVDPLSVGFGQTSALPQFFTDNQFQYKDDVSVVYRRHTFKFGGEYRRTRNGSSFQATRNGFFLPHDVESLLTDGFFGDESDLAVFGGPVFGAFTFAQASINPLTGQLPEFYRGYRANEMALYAQDDWKIHSRVTVNLGVRWEYFGPPHNFKAGLDSNYFFGSPLTPLPNPFTDAVGTCTTPSSANCPNPFYPFNFPQAAMVLGGRFVQRDRDIWRKDTNNWGPRIGVAWDVFGSQKLIFRAGGGFFFDRIWNNLFENIRFNAPFFSFNTVGTFGNGIPAGPLSTPGLFTVPFTSTSAFNNPLFAPAPAPRHMDENLTGAYTQQYNVGLQWEFMGNFALEINGAYTGGRSLTGVIDINTYNGRLACSSAAARPECVAAQMAGVIPRTRFSSRRVTTALAGDNFRTNAFASNYYGMQVVVRKAISHGLQFNSNYTWGHVIDEVSDAFNNARGASLRPSNNFNVHLDRGNADFDVQHRWVTTFFYELPFLKANRWAGGWVFSGIWTMQTGVPIPVRNGSLSNDTNRDGYDTDRPVITGNPFTQGMSPADGWLNTSAFAPATCPSSVNFGLWCDSPTGRGILRAPNFVNADFGVAKNFQLTERYKLQFQANFFNLFNHPNFAVPNGNANSSQFGRSTFVFGIPRVTQLALRFDF